MGYKFFYYDKDSSPVTANTLTELRSLFYMDDTKSAEVLQYIVKYEWTYRVGVLRRVRKSIIYKNDKNGFKYSVNRDGSLGKRIE